MHFHVYEKIYFASFDEYICMHSVPFISNIDQGNSLTSFVEFDPCIYSRWAYDIFRQLGDIGRHWRQW